MGAANCPKCGSDAVVTVLADGEEDGGRLRSYCSVCAEQRTAGTREELRSVAKVAARGLVYGGILLGLLALTADYLTISGRTGFGWRQMTGLEVGFLSVALGLFLRSGFLAMAGMFLLVLSIGADLLRVGEVPGFGWRAHLSFVTATALLCAGVYWERALARGAGLPRARSGKSLASH